MKLTKAQKKWIQAWLNMDSSDQVNYCPFQPPFQCDVCAQIFPSLAAKREQTKRQCPCRHYTLTNVRRIARRAIA